MPTFDPEEQYRLDQLDPLGTDWKSRGERGTARLRERAIQKDAEELVPVGALESILVDLASTTQGLLAGIPDALRSAGAGADMVRRAAEIVQEAQLQVSLAMDGAAQQAAQQVDAAEDALLASADAPSPIGGPVERRERSRKPGRPARPGGAPTSGQFLPKIQVAPTGAKLKRGVGK